MLAAALFVLLLGPFGQLPPSQKLSPEDQKGFNEELERVKKLLSTANDKGAVEFQVARTYAAGGQYAEAVAWLRKVVDEHLGFDPARDRLFADLRETSEVKALSAKIRADTPPISSSFPVTTISEADLFPENFAYDERKKAFYLGSTFKNEIVRCDARGSCEPFANLGYVRGLKIHPATHTLWTTSNTNAGASLNHYGLATGKLLSAFPLTGRHVFNDLTVSRAGDVYVTDTAEGAVYKVSSQSGKLERFVPAHDFPAANGIALSADERTLYVANFGDGISVVDLSTRSVKPLTHPAGVCLSYIDGLYHIGKSLIAIQNGPMVPRIVRFALSAEGRAVASMTVLERRNPLFDGLTTGTIVGGRFLYIANPQIDKVENGKVKPTVELDPLRILAIRLTRP